MSALLEHWPHILPVLAAFAALLYLWRANRSWHAEQAAEREHAPAASTRASAPGRGGPGVRRETARRGAILLAPLIAASATGVAIYGLSLAAARPGEGVLWTHAGLSLLLCLLAIYKLADVDRRRWLSAAKSGSLRQAGASALLGALLIPLLATGVALLIRPASGSFAAYAHLITSAWWTLLAASHLARYSSRSLRALRSSALS
jgi:uncharacterized membrane protein